LGEFPLIQKKKNGGHITGHIMVENIWEGLKQSWKPIVRLENTIKMQNKLRNTKTYLVGAMEYKNGRRWREDFTKKMSEIGVICFDPYKKPFVIDVDETEDVHERLVDLRTEGNYDEVSRIMKKIRAFDLGLTDRADFIVAYIDPSVFTTGSLEEIFWSNRMKKVIFLVIEGGKKKCPLWLFGAIPHKYIYNNLDEVVEVLKRIDSGEKEMDSDRWRLLKPAFR